MKKSDILVLVKTYPEISNKYTETVCTAGIVADTNRLIRLYPIRFRYLEGEQQFSKYQWIKAYIQKAGADPRPESYNIDPDSIEVGDTIPASKNWNQRYNWVINERTIFSSVEALRDAQKRDGTSLGIVKPKDVERVIIQPRDKREVEQAIAKKDCIVKQLDFFETKKDLYILPVRIMIEFLCDAPECKGHKMSILDWEFGQLYRKVANEKDWQSKIETKIMEEIFGETRDTYIILGNIAAHPQTFCVLGFFWPPKSGPRQLGLFH